MLDMVNGKKRSQVFTVVLWRRGRGEEGFLSLFIVSFLQYIYTHVCPDAYTHIHIHMYLYIVEEIFRRGITVLSLDTMRSC